MPAASGSARTTTPGTGGNTRLPENGWRVEGERAAWPRVIRRPHPLLGRLLARPYAGLSAASPPHRLLMPATTAVPLVVKLCDSPHRPPAFLRGAFDRYALVDGECARSYLEVWMAPLGAYRLLGRPVHELSGTVVDLRDIFGASGRRLSEMIRETPTWRGRFTVLDRFLLVAAEKGPRPSPEVAGAGIGHRRPCWRPHRVRVSPPRSAGPANGAGGSRRRDVVTRCSGAPRSAMASSPT
jgi:hypothetical protein